MKPLDLAEAHLRDQPAADDPADDADDDVGEAAARGLAAEQRARDRARDEADDDPADDAHVQHVVSLAWRGRSRLVGRRKARRTASDDTASGCVWCAACVGARDHDDPAVGEAVVERHGRLAEDREARAAEDLEHRLADPTEELERGDRVPLRGELADDRRRRRDADAARPGSAR